MAQAESLINPSQQLVHAPDRRSLVFGLAALPASALASNRSHVHVLPDAELLAAARTVEEAVRLINAGIEDDHFFRKYWAAWRRVHDLPATTLEGLKAKARVAATVEFDAEDLMASIGRDLLTL